MVQNRLENKEASTQRLVLAIGNMYEFNNRHNHVLSLNDLIALREQKESFAASAEMALFWGGHVDAHVVVLPIQPDPGFVTYLMQRLGVTIKCISPALVTGWVCRDLLMDNDALNELLHYLESYEVQIIPWGATEYCYQLIDLLFAKGIKIIDTGCPPIESHWIVEYCDSKVGSRSIIELMRPLFSGFSAPPGYVCHGPKEATVVADALSRRTNQPVILKSDIGAGGSGVKLYRHEKNPQSQTSADLLLSMNSNELWQNLPTIVEIAIGGGVDLTTPSFDGIVRPDGTVITMGIEDNLTIERRSSGVEMGKDVLAPPLYEQLERIGLAIGEHIASLGFRGWYDVDFLLPLSGTPLYASELNPRRGGATPAIEVGQRLLGAGWEEHYFFKLFERLRLSRSMRSYEELMLLFTALNDQFAPRNAEIIPLYPSAALLKKPFLTYMLYAKNRADAIALESELVERLRV